MADLMIGLLVAAVALSILLPCFLNVKETTSREKLKQDVALLNRSVRVFQMMGGRLDGLTQEQDVLARLKTGLSEENKRKALAQREAVVDFRLEAVMQTADQCGKPEPRAVWDAGKFAFIILNSGRAGIREFTFGDHSSNEMISERSRFLDAAKSSGWVWEFNDKPVITKGPADSASAYIGLPNPTAPADDPELNNPFFISSARAWGYFLSADLDVMGIELASGEVGLTTREASEPFSENHRFEEEINLPVLGVCTALSVQGTAFSGVMSDVNGQPGIRHSAGIGEATSFSLSLIDLPRILLLDPPPVLELQAELLRASASVSGTPENFSALGNSTVTGLHIKVMGGRAVKVNLMGHENESIELDAFGLAGVRLVVNKSHSGHTGGGYYVTDRTALFLEISALQVAGLGLVKGNIHVGRAGAGLLAFND